MWSESHFVGTLVLDKATHKMLWSDARCHGKIGWDRISGKQ